MNPLFSPKSQMYPHRVLIGACGSPIVIIKALLIGLSPSQSLADGNLDKPLKETIRYLLQHNNLPTQMVTLSTLVDLIDDSLSLIPFDILYLNDFVLQSDGEIICWPPHENTDKACSLLPPFLNWPGVGRIDGHISTGTSIFYIKCLFRGTNYYSGYPINNIFCEKLAQTIANFQVAHKLDADCSFGPATRAAFNKEYNCNLNAVPRSILTDKNYLTHVL